MGIDTRILGRYGSSTNDVADARLDASTHTLQFIDYEHHEIHSGSSFNVHYSNTTTNNDDHRTGIAFKTPATKEMHLVVTLSASSAAEVFLLEAPTIGTAAAGTRKVAYNRNRNSTTTSLCRDEEAGNIAGGVSTYTEAQLVTANVSAGTELEYAVLQAGGGPKPLGGTARGSQEWILKSDTLYLIYIKNIGAAANAHNIALDWYEHTPKD